MSALFSLGGQAVSSAMRDKGLLPEYHPLRVNMLPWTLPRNDPAHKVWRAGFMADMAEMTYPWASGMTEVAMLAPSHAELFARGIGGFFGHEYKTGWNKNKANEQRERMRKRIEQYRRDEENYRREAELYR